MKMEKFNMIIRKAKKSDIEDILILADQLRKTEAPLDKTKNLKEVSYLSAIYREKELKYITSRKKVFLVAENDDLLLLEIEDNSPHMSLEELDEAFRDKVLEEYKKVLYEYIEN